MHESAPVHARVSRITATRRCGMKIFTGKLAMLRCDAFYQCYTAAKIRILSKKL
jgi:hypothetical protein